MKILYFDTETTGVDPIKNDIIDIAFIIEENGRILHEESVKMQPFNYNNIDAKAIETHGITIEQMKTYPTPVDSYFHLLRVFEKYVNRYKKETRMFPAGYNCQFDLNFLSGLFRKVDPNNVYGLGSWIQWIPFDLMQQLRNDCFLSGGSTQYKNFKLKTIAEKHGITFKAHDALEDIRATRELILRYRHNRTLEPIDTQLKIGEIVDEKEKTTAVL